MINILRSTGVALGVFLALAGGLALSSSAHAQTATDTTPAVDLPVPDAGQGDLIKCDSSSSVYLYGEDNKRYVFQNADTFFSWHKNFDNVQTIACADLASLPIGGIVPYQAGTKLIKIRTSATVYTVLPNGRLRAIRSEAQAKDLFGDKWSDRVRDIDESFFPQYEVEDELEEDELPEGFLFEDEDGNNLQIDADGEAVELDEEIDDEDKSDPSEYRKDVIERVIKHLIEDLDFDKHDSAIRALRRAIHIDNEDKAEERSFKVARHALKKMIKAERKLMKAEQALGLTSVGPRVYKEALGLVEEAKAHLKAAREAFQADEFASAYEHAKLSKRSSSRALKIMRIDIGDDDENNDDSDDEPSNDDENSTDNGQDDMSSNDGIDTDDDVN